MARGGACTTRTAGVSTIAAGLGLVGLGLWARRDVRRGLARERIVAPPDVPVRDAAAARSLAENPHEALWVESTALQTALMHAYLAQRLAELTAGLGVVLVGVGAGLAAAPRR